MAMWRTNFCSLVRIAGDDDEEDGPWRWPEVAGHKNKTRDGRPSRQVNESFAAMEWPSCPAPLETASLPARSSLFPCVHVGVSASSFVLAVCH